MLRALALALATLLVALPSLASGHPPPSGSDPTSCAEPACAPGSTPAAATTAGLASGGAPASSTDTGLGSGAGGGAGAPAIASGAEEMPSAGGAVPPATVAQEPEPQPEPER